MSSAEGVAGPGVSGSGIRLGVASGETTSALEVVLRVVSGTPVETDRAALGS